MKKAQQEVPFQVVGRGQDSIAFAMGESELRAVISQIGADGFKKWLVDVAREELRKERQ